MSLVEHAAAALALQIAIGLVTRNWWAGALLACGYFIGRELAQAEYRWIEQFGAGLRANTPWWAALDPKVWTKADQIADMLGPIMATGLLGAIMRRRAGVI